MRRFAVLAALSLVPMVAAARGKDKKQSGGMLMPDLSKVLGDAWAVPPELSDRAQPGAILEVSAAGYRRVLQGCIDAKPNESSLTNVSMQNSLSGGVGWGSGPVGASSSVARSMKISFQGPTVLGFDLIDFVPTSKCVEKVSAYATRGGDLTSLVVVQEALLARVSGCEQSTVSAEAKATGGSGSASASGACQMFSDAPVAVGVKSVALHQIPEFAAIVGTAPGASSSADLGSEPTPLPTAPGAVPPMPDGDASSRYTYIEPREEWPATPVVRRCPEARVPEDVLKRAVAFWKGEGFAIEYSSELLPADACKDGYAKGFILIVDEDGMDASALDTQGQNWLESDDDSKVYSYKIRVADDAVTKTANLVYALGKALRLASSTDPDNVMYD